MKKQKLNTIQKSIEKNVMPEVRRQVKVYEDAKRAGTLRPTPTHNPLFSE